MRHKSAVILSIVMLLILILSTACQPEDKTLVVYTSVDRVYAEPILKAFADESGIEVLPVYDVEATKTTGLYNRLVAEKDSPKADVFWNGEILYTLKLKENDVLQAYDSPANSDLPDDFVDADHMWTAFGGRARVIIINTDLVAEEDYPTGFDDFLDDNIPGDQKAIAKPLFGTTSTHMSALYAYWGKEKAEAFFRDIADSDIQIVDGNGAVRDLVASGKLAYGLTDTDDALGAIEKDAPVTIIFPDQEPSQPGTLVTPNSVAIIGGAKHPDEAKTFVDWLLSHETMAALIESNWCQVSVRNVDADYGMEIPELKLIDIGYEDIEAKSEEATKILTELFNR